MKLTATIEGDPDRSTPLLLAHGLLGSRSNWRSVQRKLIAADIASIALDLRNHGDSPHAEPHDYVTLAKDILQQIDLFGKKSLPLLGHSMGGKAAMIAALLKPEAISRLIIVDIAPKAHHSVLYQDVITAMQSLDLQNISSRTLAQQTLEQELAKGRADPALSAFLAQNLARSDQGMVWRPALDILLNSMADIAAFPAPAAATYQGPVTFIKGENSDYIKEDDQLLCRQFFPNAQFLTIPEAGHWPHSENPPAFMEALFSALES